MSYRTYIKVYNDPLFYPNGLYFQTSEEAKEYGQDKLCAWTLAEQFEVREDEHAANYRYVNHQLEPLP
jgi:hypothetical protein